VAAVDQRGEARIFNGIVDIGAYEFDPATRITAGVLRRELHFYPNPATDQLFVHPGGASGTASIALFSGHQQLVLEQSCTIADPDEAIMLKLPALIPGFYVIRYRDDAGVRYGKLLIR
jgi:hypothetical protein